MYSYNITPGKATLAALLLLGPLAGADDISKRHVQLVTPTPFDWDEYGPTNPLNPDGSDYPCKVPQGDAFRINGTATEMAIGEEQTVSFAGLAVHGGGSCQFALTEGHAPTRDSAWKVIHSIEGGCPKAHVAGNLVAGQEPDTYTFAIPEDFAPGNYTWAWTWVNRIAGSPEFYMNCAPITVTAGAGSARWSAAERRRAAHAARTATYPDLFLANLGSVSGGCDTSEALYSQIAIAYPSPGSSVSYPNGKDNLFAQPCDGNPRNNGAAASSSSLSSTPVASSTGGTGYTATSSPTAVTTSTSAEASSTTLETSSLVSSSSLLTSTVSPTPSSSVATSSTASAPTSTSSTSLDSPCTDGYLLCVDGTQFSTCTGGKWDAPQNLAPNTTCEEDGPSVGLITTYHWD